LQAATISRQKWCVPGRALAEWGDGRKCGSHTKDLLRRIARMIWQKEIHLNTSGHRDMHDLTDDVARIVAESGIRSGIAQVFNVGSTGAIGTIEFEPGLQGDLPSMLDRLFPPSLEYGHEKAWHDGNGHSHLQATMLGPSLSLPVRDGKPVLGTWQQIFHLECDVKARRRTVMVTVIGG
jgi:secondary thiamine-phosphate synthase enzyme